MNKNTFEEKYFKEEYGHIADFSRKTTRKNYNWFKSLFHAINSRTNILEGKGKTALEFGCATGAASKVLYDYGYELTATDISSYAVKHAKKLNPEILFIEHDAQKAFQNGKKYNLVLALDVIEHLENPQKAINNMYNLVKVNGLVICSTPNDYTRARNMPTHINVKKPQEWRKLFHDAGFKKIEICQMTFFPFFYRFHWRLNFALPIGVDITSICSPVFIFARR